MSWSWLSYSQSSLLRPRICRKLRISDLEPCVEGRFEDRHEHISQSSFSTCLLANTIHSICFNSKYMSILCKGLFGGPRGRGRLLTALAPIDYGCLAVACITLPRTVAIVIPPTSPSESCNNSLPSSPL